MVFPPFRKILYETLPGMQKYVMLRHCMGVSMETPPFTMTLFQSAYGQVVAWCEYSSSETDGRIAS